MCFSSVCISTLSWPWYVSVQHVFLCYPLLMLCFSSACIFMLSCPCYVSVQHVFWRYPLLMMLNAVYISVLFSPYAVFRSACISTLSCLSYVSVQHVFWCFPYDVFSSACISVLSSPCAVFQFSVYFRTILCKLCFSSARIMMCSVCISMLSSPYAVFQFSVYFQLSTHWRRIGSYGSCELTITFPAVSWSYDREQHCICIGWYDPLIFFKY